jgi:hypothetical protein
MRLSRLLAVLAACVAVLALASPAHATFHLMQIEQVIGGVNGDTTRQAIQLRMRTGSQNFVQSGQLVAWDATGANPIVVANLNSAVANGAGGDRVLILSANFPTGPAPDFTMTNLIPASYLAAGKLTWETDGAPGTQIWWALAWGGSNYTGTNTGVATPTGNDADGNFNPPFAGPLPSSGTMAVRFTGAASALSTNNAADYQVTAGAATFTNNAGQSGTVPVELMDFKVQ